jgi:hypothetical protein
MLIWQEKGGDRKGKKIIFYYRVNINVYLLKGLKDAVWWQCC